MVQNLGLLIRVDAVDRVCQSVRWTKEARRNLDRDGIIPSDGDFDDATHYAFPATNSEGALRLLPLDRKRLMLRLELLRRHHGDEAIDAGLDKLSDAAEDYVPLVLSGCHYIYVPVHVFAPPSDAD